VAKGVGLVQPGDEMAWGDFTAASQHLGRWMKRQWPSIEKGELQAGHSKIFFNLRRTEC